MTARRNLVLPVVALGVLLVVVAVVYWIDSAGSLPSFFPGHAAGSTHHHYKHGIAAFVVALGCFAFAWFQMGPRDARQAR